MRVSDMIKEIGIIPIVVIHDIKDVKPLANALVEGGLPCAEVTFRTGVAEEAIRIMTSEFPEMLVGAGTVVTVEQVERAINAGAKFIVSPGFDPKVVDYCISKHIPIYPGCITPSDMIQAVNKGIKVIKFFPAESFGGISTIKALSAPFADIKFMPTGGISAKNLENYLIFDRIIACGGSWMVKDDLIKGRKFEEIRRLTEEAVQLVASIRRKASEEFV